MKRRKRKSVFVENLEQRLLYSTATQPAARPGGNTGTGFFVSGGSIYDANGHQFTIEGFNHSTYWGDGAIDILALDQFHKTGANTVRVVFGDDFGPSQTPAQREAIVAKLVNQGIVPVVEDSTATGKKDPASLQKIVDTWLEPGNVAWLKKYEKQVILNIANEWGPDSTVWRDEYKKAIGRLRAAGIKNLLMVDSGDAPGPGQSAHTIETWGKDLIDADPQHNVVLSIHMYNAWRTEDGAADVGKYHPDTGNPWDIENELKKIKSMNLPVVVGEFSSDKYSVVKYDTARALQVFHDLGVGWIAWSWNANAVSSMNMVWNWAYDSDADLKDFGRLIITSQYGLKNTAKKATIFTDSGGNSGGGGGGGGGGDVGGAISGMVFNDKDRDGHQDASEGAVEGAVVYIDADKDGKLDAGERQTKSGSDGAYSFANLAAGTYVVRVVRPETKTSTGLVPLSVWTGNVKSVSVAPGKVASGVNLASAGRTTGGTTTGNNNKKQTAYKSIRVGSSLVTIQAEDYDNGGEGVAYHDKTGKNVGKKHRTGGVDVQTTTDKGGGYNVGWTKAGEWMEYTIHVDATGYYDMGFRVASIGSGGKFHLEVDGKNVTGTLGVTRTRGWQKWKSVVKNLVKMSAGDHVLRLVMDHNGSSGSVGNFNYFTLKKHS